MKINLQFKIYSVTLFILFVTSMYPWFLWSMSPIFICFLCFIASVFFFATNREMFQFKRKHVLLNILFILSFLFYLKGFSFLGIIELFFTFVIIFLAINIRDEIKVKLFDYLTQGMAVLLSISMFFYTLYTLGLPLPSTTIATSNLGYTGINYYFFLTNLETSDFYRFRSIFAEPGHLSMGLIPLLFANKFNIRNKYVAILLIAALLTLSLAGYASIFLGLIIYSFSKSANRFYPRLVVGILVTFSVFFVNKLQDDDILYLALVSRLAFDESKGTIAGNNRTDDITDSFFEKFVHTPDVYFGLGNERTIKIIDEGGAGYKIFLIRFGMITALLIVFFYFATSYSYRSFDVLGLLLIILLLLYQNSYPFWFCVVFGYIFGIAKLKVKPNDHLYIETVGTTH